MAEEMRGVVASVEITGNGQNSAQIVFVVQPDQGQPAAFVVLAYPSHEPQVFSGMASLLSAVYFAKARVGVTYEPSTTHTPRAIGLFVPA